MCKSRSRSGTSVAGNPGGTWPKFLQSVGNETFERAVPGFQRPRLDGASFKRAPGVTRCSSLLKSDPSDDSPRRTSTILLLPVADIDWSGLSIPI